MLQRLYVQNVLFINKIDIDFENGLTVITGETGAGKSVLLECIKFALGEKIPATFSAQDNQQSVIFLEFNIASNNNIKAKLAENSITVENDLLSISRVFSGEKKSKFFLNDTPVNGSLIKNIATDLIEYQGQHGLTLLLDVKTHLTFLDQYGGLGDEVAKLQKEYKLYRTAYQELIKLEEEAKFQDNEKDYLTHICNELRKISPQPNEAEILADKRKVILDQQKIIDAVKIAISLLEDNKIGSALINAYKSLLKIQETTVNQFSVIDELNILDRLTVEVNDLIDSLSSKLLELSENHDLATIEDRLFLLRELARKYRCLPDELGNFLIETEEKLNKIETIDHFIANKKREVSNYQVNYCKLAQLLAEKRKNIALDLEKLVAKELISLKMEKTIFKVQVNSENDNFSATGIDKVEFLVTTNPGLPLGPLKDIASGGELSRFMLAIRVVLSKLKSPPTIIFDEIDTGVGGAVADAVGEKLSLLSKNYQLLVITHHPQVAAKADHHLLIEKNFAKEQTNIKVIPLTSVQKTEELARMLSGKKITQEARIAAEQLLSDA